MTTAVLQLAKDWYGQAFQQNASNPPLALVSLAAAIDTNNLINGGTIIVMPGTAPLVIAGGATVPASIPPNTVLEILSNNTGNARGNIDAFAGAAIWAGRRANGNSGAMTALGGTDLILQLGGRGYDGTTYSLDEVAIDLTADGTWTASSHPTRINIRTNPSGSIAAPVTVASFLNSGIMTVGTTAAVGTSVLQVNGGFLFDTQAGVAALIGTVAIGSSAGVPVIISGAGAPSATQPNGSIYLRTDGGANTRIYVSEGGGAWAPISSA